MFSWNRLLSLPDNVRCLIIFIVYITFLNITVFELLFAYNKCFFLLFSDIIHHFNLSFHWFFHYYERNIIIIKRENNKTLLNRTEVWIIMVLHLKCIFKKYNYEMETFNKMHATIITRKGKSVRLLIKFYTKLDSMCWNPKT